MYIMQNNKCSHLFQICDKQFYWVFPLTFQRTCDILSCVNVFVLYINTKREGPFSQYPTDIPRMKAALVLSVFIAQAFGQTAECNPPLPSECGETDIRWDSSNLLFLPHLLITKLWPGNICGLLAGRPLYARGFHLSSLLLQPRPLWVPGRRGDVRHGNICRGLLAGRLLHGRGIHLSHCVQHSGLVSVLGGRDHLRLRGRCGWLLDGRLLHASGFRLSSCLILIFIKKYWFKF